MNEPDSKNGLASKEFAIAGKNTVSAIWGARVAPGWGWEPGIILDLRLEDEDSLDQVAVGVESMLASYRQSQSTSVRETTVIAIRLHYLSPNIRIEGLTKLRENLNNLSVRGHYFTIAVGQLDPDRAASVN